MKFAASDFTLSVKQDDGHSLREHLVSGWRQSGVMPDELRLAPKLPDLARYLWEYFVKIHRRRTNYGWGHVPLSCLEVESWARLNKVRLDVWEVDAILAVDDAYIASLPKPKGS